ncbi:hypothetical protein O3M35_004257 [Rhynocoris fuscipes]|uniref:DNA ligase 4 n=1 Tax=Rhynocoris fuscipes TaxID=488301 RepID=A0AAW1CGY7_9HEMI
MDSDNNIENVLFHNFCKLCESVSKCSDRKLKITKIKEYLRSLRVKCPDANFFILLRFFLPFFDRERGPYGIKEYNLAKIYIRILDLPKEGKDAKTLLNFRSPSTMSANQISTDFADVAYWILQNRCGNTSNLKIGEVDRYLDRISEEHAAHNPRAVDDILMELFRKMSAIEQKWLIRLILKHLNLGLGAKILMESYHPDAMELYDVCSNLKKVATRLNNENIRLHELDIHIFEPFRPMLSERIDISKKKFTGEYFIDEKLDGERFQIHYSNGKFKYFSRNSFEFTNIYGENHENGYFTSLLYPKIKPGVESFILDGEMMGWHTKKLQFVTKASNIDVKSLRVGDILQPCFCAFDIVYFNGTILTNRPNKERIDILQKIFEPCEGVIVHTPRILAKKHDDIMNALNNAIDNQLEGIIVKDINSLYKPNSRNSGWFKLKPEYTDGALVELDLLIIGGYYGEGRKKGIINQFLLGLAVPNKQGLKQFSSLCRVGSGYSNLELNELLSKLNPNWCKFRPGKSPPHLLLAREKPDVWIEPSKSHILQVKGSEVIISDLYHFGYTLRFPRVEKVRLDKPWNDCLTTVALAEIVKTYSAKLTNFKKRKHDSEIEIVEPSTSIDSSNIEKIGNIFDGKEICVLTGDNTISKETLQKMVVEQNGSSVNVPGIKTFCIIAGDINVRVQNIINAKKHVVCKPIWIENSIKNGKILPFFPDQILSAPIGKRLAIKKEYDRYLEENNEPIP